MKMIFSWIQRPLNPALQLMSSKSSKKVNNKTEYDTNAILSRNYGKAKLFDKKVLCLDEYAV